MRQQLVDLAQAHVLAVEEVFIAPVAVRAPRQNHLREINRQPAGRIVEEHIRRGHASPRPLLGTGEDQILGPLGAQQAVRLFAQHPAQRVGDVGFAGAVRPDDGRDPFGEFEGCLGDEGFISVQFERFQS